MVPVQTTQVHQKDINKMYEGIMKDLEKTLADLKKMLEKQKIAEEQERLRKIQVSGILSGWNV